MGAGGKLRFEKLAHVVDLTLDGVAGDGTFGPALGDQGADSGAVRVKAFVKNRLARGTVLRAHGAVEAAKVEYEMGASG